MHFAMVVVAVLAAAVLATAGLVAAVVAVVVAALAVVVAFAEVSLRMISCYRNLENRSFLPFSEKA